MAEKQCTGQQTRPQATCRAGTGRKKLKEWKKPLLEDVSGKVMAQPYIRFT